MSLLATLINELFQIVIVKILAPTTNKKVTFMKTKFDYRKIYERFAELSAGALFMKAGPEKYKIVFSLARRKCKEIDHVVWIAPSYYLATEDYVNDIKSAAGRLADKIVFYSIENISMNDAKYLHLYNLATDFRVFCIVDESITIKNTEAGRTKRLLAMKHKFKYRVILSGTPLTQGLIDLYSQVQFMDSAILNMTETQFMHNFLPFYEDDFETWRRWSNPEHEAQLVEMIRPYLLACDFEDNVKIIYHNADFQLTPQEEEVYRFEKEDFLKNKEQVAFLQVVQRFQYLYTICKNKVNALFKLVDEILARHEKVIIYTKFLSEVKFFKEAGGFGNHKFVVMSGNSNKIKALNRFEKNVDIMICTYKVESPRLNLRGCNNIIYFTQTFDYKDKIQTLTSFYNKEEIQLNIYDFWVDTRLEGLIKDNLYRKKNVLKNVCRIMSKDEALKL